jgi:hypothetical protein
MLGRTAKTLAGSLTEAWLCQGRFGLLRISREDKGGELVYIGAYS